MKSVLKVQNLCVSYGSVAALRGVSLEILEGETVTVVGANGAGKSTLLKAISGVVRPTERNIELFGEALRKWDPIRMVKYGVIHVPEGRQIFGNMTVWENLMIGGDSQGYHTEVKENLASIYNIFPILKKRSNQLAGTLSGGEQQMLAIGRGLMGKPKLLMMDEPSLGLAPLLVKEIFATISTLEGIGITVLLVEQNAVQALRIADRGYILALGKVAATGVGSELSNDLDLLKTYLGMREIA